MGSVAFWTLGSFAGVVGTDVLIAALVVIPAVAVLARLGPRLDALALGEVEAGHLGVDVRRLTIVISLVVTLLTAVAVAVAGVIAFVALLVPGLVRPLLGQSHRAGRRRLGAPGRDLAGAGRRARAQPLLARRAVRRRHHHAGRGALLPVAAPPRPGPPGAMTYAARGIDVRVGGATLLADVSVEVAAGELVAVAGPNGAGKSTLIATLAGDRRPDRGRVTLAGRALADWPRRELARAAGGHERRTHRRLRLHAPRRSPCWAGCRCTAATRPRPTGPSCAACWRRSTAPTCPSRVFATLSTGERQRVALARAIAQVTDAHGDETRRGCRRRGRRALPAPRRAHLEPRPGPPAPGHAPAAARGRRRPWRAGRAARPEPGGGLRGPGRAHGAGSRVVATGPPRGRPSAATCWSTSSASPCSCCRTRTFAIPSSSRSRNQTAPDPRAQPFD